MAEGEQNIARQREITAGLEGSGPESGALQTARELLRQIARYWQMRVEEIQTFVGLARSVNDVEATEIVLRIAGDYQRLVQRSCWCRAPILIRPKTAPRVCPRSGYSARSSRSGDFNASAGPAMLSTILRASSRVDSLVVARLPPSSPPCQAVIEPCLTTEKPRGVETARTPMTRARCSRFTRRALAL